MQNINPTLVGAAYTVVVPMIEVSEDDTVLTATAKYTTGVLAYSTLALIGVIEAVVRNILSLSAKGIELFLSGEEKRDFCEEVLNPLMHNARKTTEFTGRAAAATITQFLSRKTRSKVAFSIHKNVKHLYGHPVKVKRAKPVELQSRPSRSDSFGSTSARSRSSSSSSTSSTASSRGSGVLVNGVEVTETDAGGWSLLNYVSGWRG